MTNIYLTNFIVTILHEKLNWWDEKYKSASCIDVNFVEDPTEFMKIEV